LVLFTSVRREIERKCAGVIAGPLQHRGMTQRAARVVVSGAPVLLHAQARELVVLGMAFVVPCAIDQMNDVVDFAVGGSSEQLRFGAVPQVFRQLFEQARDGATQSLAGC
jgi:hypothetical protein